MEGSELEFREEALRAVARKAMERKTGARGLRTILEHILLDTMYDLPSMQNVRKVVIDDSVVEGHAKPYFIYENIERARPRHDDPPLFHSGPAFAVSGPVRSTSCAQLGMAGCDFAIRQQTRCVRSDGSPRRFARLNCGGSAMKQNETKLDSLPDHAPMPVLPLRDVVVYPAHGDPAVRGPGKIHPCARLGHAG
jgi:hypothetical protein